MPPRIDDAAQRAAHARYRRKIAQLTSALRIDAIHVHGVDYAAYLPPPGPPLVVTLHLPAAFYPRAAFEQSRPRTTFVCSSESQRQALPRLDDVRVVGNGVCLDAFAPSTQPIGDRRYVLVVSRICPEKGVHLALEAARRADVDLVLAGEVFPYEEHVRYYKDRVAPLLDERRRNVGPVRLADRRALLAGARCLLVPSLAEETSSPVAMEALASGRPVIAFRAGALPEIIEHGRTGFIVADVDEMARAIGWASELSPEACRRAAELRFDGRAMCGSYLALYAELTGARWRASATELRA
jgi:glycosyltransferase involved in cell wall biosynthesis